MHLMDQKTLGFLILLLLGILVAVKRIATGSILEKPEGSLLLWLVNGFNLFFLLIVNPLAAILLITGRMESIDPASAAIRPSELQTVVEVGGFIFYLGGVILMACALLTLRGNYQLGGSNPRTSDTLIINGPYAFIRHLMYTAALSIAFGLSCMLQSLVCLGISVVYVVLILLLLPVEEERLLRAYGEPYRAFRQKARKLLPFLY